MTTQASTSLDAARTKLAELETSAAHYQTEIVDAERTLRELRQTRAPITDISSAMQRRDAAKETLAWLGSALDTVRADVERLEGEGQRDAAVAELRTHAQRAAEHRAALGEAVAEGSEVLAGILARMETHVRGWHASREGFVQAALPYAPGMGRQSDVDHDRARAMVSEASKLLAELRTDTSAITDAATGWLTLFDQVNVRRVPGAGEPLAPELYGALARTRDPELTRELPFPSRPPR